MGQAAEKRSAVAVLGDAGLRLSILAAAAGIATVVVMTLAGVRPVINHSDAMSPAYGDGSVAFVRKVPVSGISAGDVVLTQRQDVLVSLERVVAVSAAGSVRTAVLGSDADPGATESVDLSGPVYRAWSWSLPLGPAGRVGSPMAGLLVALLILLPLLARTSRAGLRPTARELELYPV